jgi:hypothetical protein
MRYRNATCVVSPAIADDIRNVEVLGNIPVKFTADILVTLTNWKVH